MLFTFDESFTQPETLQRLSSDPQTLELSQGAFSNLILGWREGKLLLLVPTELREALCAETSPFLEPREKQRLMDLCRLHRQDIGTLSGRLTVQATITSDLHGAPVLHRSLEAQGDNAPHKRSRRAFDGISEDCTPSRLKLMIPLGYFHDSARIQRAALVAEDEYDARFFARLGQAYLQGLTDQAQRTPFRVDPKIVGGGGDRSYTHVVRELHSQPTLVIVDSDRREEKGAKGPTATKVCRDARKCLKESALVGEVCVLTSRMLENLIPRALLAAIGEGGPGHDPAFQASCQKKGRPLEYGSEELRFLHGKEGLRGADWHKAQRRRGNKESEPQYQKRLEEAEQLKALMEPLRPHASEPSEGWCAIDSARCVGKERSACSCIYFYGLPGGCIERLVKGLEKTSVAEAALRDELFGSDKTIDPMQQERRFLANRVLAWTVAAQPSRLPA